MKFQHLILACAIAVFTLPACSSSDKNDDSDSKKSEKEELSSDVITEEYCFVPKTEDEIKEAKEIQRQKKLEEKWVARAENVLDFFNIKANKIMAPYRKLDFDNISTQEQTRISQEIQDAQQSFIKNYGTKLVEKANKIKEGYEKDCPDLTPDEKLSQLFQLSAGLEAQLKTMGSEVPTQDESVPTDSIKA